METHFAVYILLHIFLALVIRSSAFLATLYVLLFFGAAFGLAAAGSVEVAAFACAYTAGGEVLWRMTGARIPWEAGKYVTSAILLVSIARASRWRPPPLPTLYFALLIPSIVFVITMSDLSRIRQDLSFNLSGPFSLMIVAWFFSGLELSRSEVLCLFKVVVGPLAGIAAIALYTTLSAVHLQFGHESLKITSGGFGPNQVSSVLGLGCLLCILHVIEPGLGSPPEAFDVPRGMPLRHPQRLNLLPLRSLFRRHRHDARRALYLREPRAITEDHLGMRCRLDRGVSPDRSPAGRVNQRGPFETVRGHRLDGARPASRSRLASLVEPSPPWGGSRTVTARTLQTGPRWCGSPRIRSTHGSSPSTASSASPRL